MGPEINSYNSGMYFISILYHTILDALFPISGIETEVLSLSPRKALDVLSPAPDYSGLAFDLPGTHSIFAYKDERVSRLIWLIKEKRSVKAVEIAGYALWRSVALAPKYPGKSFPSPGVLVPIPITTRRRRQRGYNQCELLIDEIMRLQSEAHTNVFISEYNLLTRTDRGAEQKTKNRAGRVAGSHDIFAVNMNVATMYDRTTPIIIIDDVITTGSTMYAAINTLKKVGFTDVRGLSVGH